LGMTVTNQYFIHGEIKRTSFSFTSPFQRLRYTKL